MSKQLHRRFLRSYVYLYFAHFFLFFVLSAGWAEETTTQNLNRRLNQLENAFHRAANPPALLAPGPFIQGDVLFWQARETGLAYGIIASQPISLDGLPRRFDIKELEYEWDFGFRLGLGYGTKRDGWDFFAQWTRFFTDAHDNGMISSSKSFLPVWSDPNFNTFPFNQITETEAHWMLHFNAIDAGIGRSFYISEYFALRPFIGPSSVWIDQLYHVEYEKFPRLQPIQKDHIHLKNAFFGVGAHVGCEVRFHLTHDLSLLAKGAAAIYTGQFEIKRKEKLNQDFHIKQSVDVGRAATALEMGFNWQHAMQNNRYIRAELCYDIHFFFKQNQMPRVISDTPSETFLADQGDLSLHGGSFSLTLGF